MANSDWEVKKKKSAFASTEPVAGVGEREENSGKRYLHLPQFVTLHLFQSLKKKKSYRFRFTLQRFLPMNFSLVQSRTMPSIIIYQPTTGIGERWWAGDEEKCGANQRWQLAISITICMLWQLTACGTTHLCPALKFLPNFLIHRVKK